MKTYMFPGQGSQTKGMGGPLFDRFAELTAKADAILGYSIRELCLEDPREQLNKTQFTQPALYTVNALSYFAKVEDSGRTPDFLAGHSLGEFDALMAAGCYDFETGLKLVQKRGELMGKVSGGGMAAVLNASREEIEDILRKNALDEIFLANYNSPSQIVISGSAEQIAKAQPLFKQGKIRFYPLNTSGAFHSRFMQGAMQQFREFLQNVPFAALRIPVIANVTARPYADNAVLDTLSRQIASTVQWSESVQYLIALARSRGESMEFEEFGPGDVLTRLVDTIRKQTPDAVLDGFAFVAAAPAAPVAVTPVATAPAPAALAANDANAIRVPAAARAATDKVQAWNRSHPVGTRVKSTIADYSDLETRSEALVLFGHRAAVYMKGYNGYFDLDELLPA